MELRDKRALVTGGSKGIGRAIAEALIEQGARVAIMAREPAALEGAARSLGALAIAGDVSREEDARSAVARTVGELGGIDILVNNAAIGYFDEVQHLDLRRFQEVFAVNVTGPMLMTREAAPHFMRQKSGDLVNISSTAGLKGFARGTPYVGTKFALKGMNECWRDELRRYNVRVMLLNPSEVQTGFNRREEPSELNPKKLRAREIADAVVGALRIDARGFVPELSVFATNPF
jgi:3-oxoacyl-[acyl-carrier protein] reductase